MPLVSIIVPCYKAEDHLEKTLNSLCAQSYVNIEIILVDDGNETELETLLPENLKHNKRIRIIRHEKNCGLSSSRNTGLEYSKGEFVLFWDADDILAENTIEIFVNLAIKNASEIVRGVLARSDLKSRWITKRGRRLLKNLARTEFEKSPELAMDFTSCGLLFAKSFLEKNNLVFEENLYMQDILFTSRTLLCAKNICMTDHIVGYYSQAPNSASKLKSDDRFKSLFVLYEKLEVVFVEKSISLKHREVLLAGYINAAVNTFLHWKLENITSHNKELDRLSKLLESIGEGAINQYCLDMFDEASYVRLHAMRFKKYKLAASMAGVTSVSTTHQNELFEDKASDEGFKAKQFLNNLRAKREASLTNSRMVLSNSTSQHGGLICRVKNLFTRVKSKRLV